MTSGTLRSALVTGAATRIGAAIARDLARHDFAVAIHAHKSIDAAHALADELKNSGARADVFIGDLTDWEFCERLIYEVGASFGPLGLLVNNASIFEFDEHSNFTAESFDRHFAIHARAPLLLARAFENTLPAEIRGLIVNIIDQRVWALNPRFFTYTLSKAALWTATQTLAQAMAPRIRVNAIGPGPSQKSARQSPEDFAAQINGLILRAGPGLEEFGSTIRFLFDTPSITGQMIAIDGGQHLAWETPDIAEIRE